MKRITLAELDLMIAEREWPGDIGYSSPNQDIIYLHGQWYNKTREFLDANAMLPIQMRDGLWPQQSKIKAHKNQYYIPALRWKHYYHKHPLTAVKLAYLKLHWQDEEFELVET